MCRYPRYSRQKEKRWDENSWNARMRNDQQEKMLAFFFSVHRNNRGSSKKVCRCQTGFFLRLYRHRPPSTKPAGAEPICPPQTSTAGVRHGGRQQFSSTKVGQYGCRRRFLDSGEHRTAPICLYIYKTWDFYPFQVKSKISIPTHNTKPTTISVFYLQAPFFSLPPRSDLQVVVSTFIDWWLITRLDFAGESIDG